MTRRITYPFTAIVGQDRMRLALLLHAVDPRLGGVLIRGEKGTAKSTAVRALAGLLPTIRAVAGCPFGCDPADPAAACDDCAGRLGRGEQAEVTERPVPVVELPVGATEDRLLGSLNLEHAIQHGERRFEPGLLAAANRGVLYVDEVNLLGDHLVDVLLDAAAMGRNFVERDGVSFSHPASFILIGTMNPEEGDLRPQLLDRFALVVEVSGLTDPTERAEAVQRRIAFERDPASFWRSFAPSERAEQERLARARDLLPSVEVAPPMLDLIVRICAAFEVDGLRGDLAIYHAAAAIAAYDGRTAVTAEDVRLAAELALPHRRRRGPFEQSELDEQRLDQIMQEGTPHGNGDSSARTPAKDDPAAGTETHSDSPIPDTHDGGRSRTAGARESEPGPPLALTLPRSPRRRPAQADQRSRAKGSTRAETGTAVRAGTPTGPAFELDLAATLRAAAPHQVERRRGADGRAVRLTTSDLRARVRQGRGSALVLFAVDASGSMGAQRRLALAKSAALGLLLDAYRRRDRVGLVAFRDRSAELLLPFTNSVELAERRLRSLPSGGRTPLAEGLRRSRDAIERALRDDGRRWPLLVLFSDGRANVGADGAAPWPATIRQAEAIRQRGWQALLMDPDAGRTSSGLGRALAVALGAEHRPLDVAPRRGGEA